MARCGDADRSPSSSVGGTPPPRTSITTLASLPLGNARLSAAGPQHAPARLAHRAGHPGMRRRRAGHPRHASSARIAIPIAVDGAVEDRADEARDRRHSPDMVEVEVGEHQQIDARDARRARGTPRAVPGSGPVSTSMTAPAERSEHGIALPDVACEHAPARRQRPAPRHRPERGDAAADSDGERDDEEGGAAEQPGSSPCAGRDRDHRADREPDGSRAAQRPASPRPTAACRPESP